MKFENTLIMRKIIWKMRRGYSPVILVVGPQNSGKTQLSGLVAETLHPLFNKGRWSPKDHLIFDMNVFSHKFLQSVKKIFVVAEAGFDLSFDQWFNKTNRFFDRIVTTQRVMGNCYILNIPVGKDLGRRHRRKLDYVFEVVRHGRFKAVINRVKRGIMSGDEFKSFYLEDYTNVPLPRCHREIDRLDKENKKRIREEIIGEFQEETKKQEIIKTEKKELPAKIICAKCNYEWAPKIKRPKRCPECAARLKYKENKKQDLVPIKMSGRNSLAEIVN